MRRITSHLTLQITNKWYNTSMSAIEERRQSPQESRMKVNPNGGFIEEVTLEGQQV
jgi:hypothetical protein